MWALALLVAGSLGCGPKGLPPEEPLRIGLHAAPVTLDPHIQGEAAALSILHNVYDTLTAFDAEMRLGPALAQRWSNPEDRRWRFILREGVRFHDGSTFDAEDVVFSLRRAQDLPESRAAAFLVEVEEVSAVGPREVEIVTRRPYAPLPHKLALVFMIPSGAPLEIEEPVGTGPYRLVGHDQGRKVTLEAFEGGWQPRPSEPRVEVWSFPDPEERVAALLGGEVDLVNDLPATTFRRLQDAGEPGFQTAARSGLQLLYLQVRPDQQPFEDRRVRRAIHLALDRQALVTEVLADQGRPLGQMAGPEVFGHAPQLKAPQRDLEQAQRLLRQVAEERGEGGLGAVILEHSTARNPALMAAVERQLEEAGLKVELRSRPWGEMYPRLASGQVGFYAGRWITSSGDASELLAAKVHTRDPATGYGDANSNAYSNPELDRLIEAAGAARDPLERRRLLQQCLEKLMEDPVFFPLLTPFDLYAAVDDLQWQPRADGSLPLRTMTRQASGPP